MYRTDPKQPFTSVYHEQGPQTSAMSCKLLIMRCGCRRAAAGLRALARASRNIAKPLQLELADVKEMVSPVFQPRSDGADKRGRATM